MDTAVLSEESTSSSKHKSIASLGGKYLTFKLGKEQFGLEILKVREIMGWINITPVPKAPSSIRGVINLRGKIIPVFDLRRKFQMQEVPNTDRTCIIVVDVNFLGQSTDVGILVDSVSEVLNIHSDHIGPPPSMGTSMDTDFILGMAKSNDAVTILLKIEQILSGDALQVNVGNEQN